MALDPSVITQVKTPDMTSGLANVASISASMASAANARAALPGIQADSAIKQRAAAFNKWTTANGGQFVSRPTDSDGNPIKGAEPVLDHASFVKAAADAGFLPEAQSVAAVDLSNQSKLLVNQGQQASNEGANINNATNRNALAVSARGYVSTFMDAYEKANPNATQADLDREYNKNLNGVKGQFGSGLSLAAAFGQPDQVPGPGQQTAPQWKYDRMENKATMTATMSPQVQADLKLRNETTAQSGVTGQSGPEFRDPNSKVTQQARAAAIAADPAHRDIYSGMTAAQLAQNQTVQGAVMASINPASARVSAATGFIEHTNKGKMFSNAADALDAFKQQLPQEDQQAFLSAPGAWFQNNVAKFQNNPAFTNAKFAYENAVQGNPEMKLQGLDAGSASMAMRGQAALEFRQAGTYGQAATASTSAEAVGAKPTTGSPASAGKPQNKATIDAERNAAKAAIAKGAPSDKVKERFKKNTGQDL